MTGSGNQLLFEHGTNVNGQIFVKENADLTTRVDTAFNATLNGDIVTAAGSRNANGQSFLVFEQGSTLHIDDAVKYTNAAVEGMSTAYGNLNLVLDNGALHVEDGATDRTMNILNQCHRQSDCCGQCRSGWWCGSIQNCRHCQCEGGCHGTDSGDNRDAFQCFCERNNAEERIAQFGQSADDDQDVVCGKRYCLVRRARLHRSQL